jgi:chemotaxis family two-component system sensor kinase Cph1
LTYLARDEFLRDAGRERAHSGRRGAAISAADVMRTFESPRPGEPVDLSNCDSEPIHVPGSIQPHGVLLAALEPELVVVQASVNTGRILGIDHADIVGAALADLLEAPAPDLLGRSIGPPSYHPLNSLAVTIRGRPFDGIVHRSGGLLVLELEPAPAPDTGGPGPRELYARIHDGLARLEQAPRLADLWPALATLVRDISGFDRVMVYRFDERDGSGEVIAERASPDMPPYLGLHYPASDVPYQARRLYVQSRLRLICDATYESAPIVPADNPQTGRPLDLSAAVLRSVSPIHLRYLENMGVRGSMSVSLVKDERLWGLIACHHRSPRFVPYLTRMVCGFLGDIASWSLRPRLDSEESDCRLRAGAVLGQLVEAMSARPDALAALVEGEPSALDLLDARGFAVAHGGRLATRGETPSREQLAALVTWLEGQAPRDVLATDALPLLYPPAAAFKDVASGLLAIAVANADPAHLLWFRPEVVREVSWGGDPRKPPAQLPEQLTPRKSFALWKETVRERAWPWAPWEVRAASELRAATAKVLLQKTAEQLNIELRRAVSSRDEFLSMASHELKTPTTTLRLHLEMLRRMATRGQLGGEQVLSRVERAERQVERLEVLIGRLLDVSRIAAGRLELERSRFDLAELAREVVERFGDAGPPLRLDAIGDLHGTWDRFRLDQVLTNLLANALKYGRGNPVDVVLRGEPGRVRVAVHDRGIGVAPEALPRLFDRFERAAPAKFAGLGLGLWIARQIVERHGGRISARSVPGAGSTFAFELPREGTDA